ncbi:inorganic pyrophosphatase-like [Paramacrobiotus metropolitanus]|uniref:inorganic pyrophosphatase-like n=1 Tax=Paramacrobiotus metropolitanus TaxID=2943436 RepID=UPI0024458D6E|nr:inorganic pyrophosphatase-like [Paramacrobiotus metropolitanus]
MTLCTSSILRTVSRAPGLFARYSRPLGAVRSFRPSIFSRTNICGESVSSTLAAGDMPFQAQEFGGLHHEDYRIFLSHGNTAISPFHDVPLIPDRSIQKEGTEVDGNAIKQGVYNMVVEIPRWTNAKMEINTKEPLNPIKQDVKKGKVRFVCNVFPHKGYIWNYGAFPQTWEDPEHISPETGCKGDGDPVDVCEIGHRVANRGEVLQVKVLGVIALIDEGETDWKIIAINIHDPLAEKMNDIDDVEKYMPGFMQNTIDWFRCYKMPDGKPENRFAFDGKAMGRDLAIKVVEETHQYWKDLVNNKVDRGLSCCNTTLKESPYLISSSDAAAVLSKQPKYRKTEPIDPVHDTWHYVNRTA